MAYLVDTSVLVRQADANSSSRPAALQALTTLKLAGERLCIVPQNMVELWAVATRPQTANGLGLPTASAEAERMRLETLFTLLPETLGLYGRWVQLVNRFGVSGKPTHDVRLAAAMLEHGLSHILTFNTADFVRFAPAGIVAVDPATI